MFDLKKTVEKMVRGAIAGGIAVSSAFLAKHIGLELTAEQQAALIAATLGLLSGITNFLKHTNPNAFGWL